MPETPDLSVSTHVDAPAEAVYALVADLSRMGEWSPECTEVEWRGGATGPAVGARFKGHNQAGRSRWTTDGEVVEADPGRSFAFEVTAVGGRVKVARWGYRFEPDAAGTGCTVTEEWTDRRPGLMKKPMAVISRVPDRAAHNRTNIERTLARLKAAAERA